MHDHLKASAAVCLGQPTPLAPSTANMPVEVYERCCRFAPFFKSRWRGSVAIAQHFGAVGRRLATATAITACVALKIDRAEMIRVLHEEHTFSDLFFKFLLARSMRAQADLVDHLFNSSERRLARILLLMAEFGRPGEQETLIPKITQVTLAEMIGTTRSRVSLFMNRFRELGFIEYNGRIKVHKSLLNVILHDHLPYEHADGPVLADVPPKKSSVSKRARSRPA
jgi:CRP/FNR family transcriptional regulator, cyclic AMP receptor protein